MNILQEYRLKATPNVFTREQCDEIIKNHTDYEHDVVRRDTALQSKYYDRKTLEENTEVIEDQDIRKVKQCSSNVITEWEGRPVYRCKVMKYEVGDKTDLHRDTQWMCQSNWWVPETNMVARDLVTIPLNDDYEGGDLRVGDDNKNYKIPQEIGTAVQFAQSGDLDLPRAVHGVSEITKGTRYALVFWTFED